LGVSGDGIALCTGSWDNLLKVSLELSEWGKDYANALLGVVVIVWIDCFLCIHSGIQCSTYISCDNPLPIYLVEGWGVSPLRRFIPLL
jgi:hypothetical protein